MDPVPVTEHRLFSMSLKFGGYAYNRRMGFITSGAADKNTYDVIVVGSGAGGGQTAYTLTMEGARVLMLEAGRRYEPAAETPMLQDNRGAAARPGTPDKPFGFYDATVDGGWDVPGEPYTSASNDPARQFHWWRARMLGGRTNHWGRISLRNGPYDFKPHTRDGLGFDWPIELRRPRAVLRQGRDAHRRVRHQRGPGEHAGLAGRRAAAGAQAARGELLAQKRARKLGIPVIPMHRAV